MAKKAISTLKGNKDEKIFKYVKLIKAIRNPKTGHYGFKKEMIREDKLDNALKNLES